MNEILSKIAVDLPGTADPAQLPDEIQFMPPGEHRITASRNGKPVTLTVNVDADTANRIAASHREHTDAAKRGEEDLPYFDFNHDDREAAGHPSEYFWGGTDPQRGGVRSKVAWTGAGKAALRGRNYRRFSPSFYVDDSNRISGIPVNSGGLVNRAAFKRIAPVISKSVEDTYLASADNDFVAKAEVVALARNLKLADAVEVLAHEQPWLYEEYRCRLAGKPYTPAQDEVRAREERQRWNNEEFMHRAQTLAEVTNCSIVDAFDRLAHAEPWLYERYCARIYGRELDAKTVAAAQAQKQESAFFTRAKAVAEERGIDISDAFGIVAREAPELYDSHRAEIF